MTPYPKLAAMAVAWCYAHKPKAAETLKNLEGQKVNEAYVNLAKKIVRQDLVGESDVKGRNELLALIKERRVPLKINVERALAVDFDTDASLFVTGI